MARATFTSAPRARRHCPVARPPVSTSFALPRTQCAAQHNSLPTPVDHIVARATKPTRPSPPRHNPKRQRQMSAYVAARPPRTVRCGEGPDNSVHYFAECDLKDWPATRPRHATRPPAVEWRGPMNQPRLRIADRVPWRHRRTFVCVVRRVREVNTLPLLVVWITGVVALLCVAALRLVFPDIRWLLAAEWVALATTVPAFIVLIVIDKIQSK